MGGVDFHFPLSEIFPTPKTISTDNGIVNVKDYIIAMIPLLTTLMAIGAVTMLLLGGFHMVLGGASADQTEKGKGIIKDALMGLLF